MSWEEEVADPYQIHLVLKVHLYTVYIQKKSPWKHGYIGSKVVAVHSPLTSQQKIEEQHIDHLQIYYYLKQGENY